MEANKKNLAWVTLHLVPQSDTHDMPPFVTGILTQETTGAYVLMKVLREVETEEGWEMQPSPNMHFINKTYVWNCEFLAEPPQFDGFGRPFNGEDHGGGLG